MPKGQKAKVSDESMNSRMTEESFDKLMLNNMITEMRDDVKVLLKCDFYVKNFYIQGKKGTINIWKLGDSHTFRLRWMQTNRPAYLYKCCSENGDEYAFNFKSFGEFDENLKKFVICKYHSCCSQNNQHKQTYSHNCSADYLISPKEQCAICLNNVEQHLLEETQCGHKFCLSCLNTYAESKKEQKKIPCPTCRRNLAICHCCGRAQFACRGFEDCIEEDEDE